MDMHLSFSGSFSVLDYNVSICVILPIWFIYVIHYKGNDVHWVYIVESLDSPC